MHRAHSLKARTVAAFVMMVACTGLLRAQVKPVQRDSVIFAPTEISRRPGIKRTAPPPPPPTSNAAPTPGKNTPYYLTAASVTITTGNDNKEQPSKAMIGLASANGGCFHGREKTEPCGLYDDNMSTSILNEYKVNSITVIPLITSYQFPSSLPGGVGEGWRYIDLLLEEIQKHGLNLHVIHRPNFIADAWRIERVSLTLEFKDLAGNAHPSLGSVVIPFPNSSALLNDGQRILRLQTDGSFTAGNSRIEVGR